MKNGTASSGKLSMPLTMRWITTKGGRLPADQDVDQRGAGHGDGHRQAAAHEEQEDDLQHERRAQVVDEVVIGRSSTL